MVCPCECLQPPPPGQMCPLYNLGSETEPIFTTSGEKQEGTWSRRVTYRKPQEWVSGRCAEGISSRADHLNQRKQKE